MRVEEKIFRPADDREMKTTVTRFTDKALKDVQDVDIGDSR